MIRRHAALALAAALAVSPLLAVPATAAPTATAAATAAASVAEVRPATPHVAAGAKRYKNCAALNRAYKGGVARDSKARNMKTVRGKKVRATSTYKAKVSKSLYAANKSLDRDKDGIACER
ncbi:excalibur calcium-binding domain-containing protein [Sanguibacter sp. HDW7]|uniref:excalibur calcium-binding domain-containing protein n=1 Tax=Sanguibacter sp. HDW7 TaxID=2714931 RepID=UPI00140CB969|nr:excalibur calcium-binding domain-containing protein [Sanguibacter sp. HDW7]QIK84481.1 excalibur calcium-binding domain-containing protein [Sanguibacter sp. HDW7]